MLSSQALKERDSIQAALQAMSQQADALRKELADVLGRLAQREEEARRREVELGEARALCRGLEQEAREVRDASRSLEEEAGRQGLLETRLREELRALEARADEAGRGLERERAAVQEARREARELAAERARVIARLAQEEEARGEAQRRLEEVQEEAQRQLEEAQEEARAQGQQLRLERELHHSELASLKGALQDGRVKQDRAVQEALRLAQQERKELQDQLRELQVSHRSRTEHTFPHRSLA